MLSSSSPGHGLSAWVVVILFFFLTLVSWFSYRLRGTMAKDVHLLPFFLRIGTFGTLLLMLADIGVSWTTTLVRHPLVRVFFDNSVSIAYNQSISSESLVHGYGEIASRLEHSLDELSGETGIELYSFGETPRAIDDVDEKLDFSEPVTDLASVLEATGSIQPDHFLAGMVIVTDGQVTMGKDPRQLLEGIEDTIYTIGIGEPTPLVDVYLEGVEVPTVGVKGDAVTADVSILSMGEFEERVHVTLAKGQKLLGSKTVLLRGRGSMRKVRFQFHLDETGSHRYTAQVSSIKDEINIANNRSSFVITALKDEFQVALVTGAPSANTVFIKRVLGKEDRFEVDHFVKLPNRWTIPIVQFWRNDYDLIILDNVPSETMPERWIVDLKRKLKRHPSALAYIVGPNVSEKGARSFYPLLGLKEFLMSEVSATKYSIAFSEEGERHSVLAIGNGPAHSLSAGTFLPPLRPRLFAEPGVNQMLVIAELVGPVDIPLFTLGNVMGNRTVTFASSGLWQLHFKMMQRDHADFAEQWWKRTFNWLVKSSGDENVYFRLDKDTYQQGETIEVTGTIVDLDQDQLAGGQVVMVVRDDKGEARPYPLTYSFAAERWEGRFYASRPGTYRYTIEAEIGGVIRGQQTGSFAVEESQIELNRVFLDRDLLQTIADQTGGLYLDWKDRSRIGDLVKVRTRTRAIAETLRLSHWVPLSILALLFMISEWTVRRVVGLQ